MDALMNTFLLTYLMHLGFIYLVYRTVLYVRRLLARSESARELADDLMVVAMMFLVGPHLSYFFKVITVQILNI